MFRLYLECWNGEPDNRPEMNQVVTKLSALITNSSIMAENQVSCKIDSQLSNKLQPNEHPNVGLSNANNNSVHGELSDFINNFDKIDFKITTTNHTLQSNLITNKKNLASTNLISINDDTLNDRQTLLIENLSDWAKKMSTLTGINSETQLLCNGFTQKDLFIGFDNENLESLIMDIIKNNPETNNNRILETCKECLIATASPDGIVRAERSALERDEVDRWKHVYFHQQHHESLYDYFANQENLSSDLNGHLVVVNTFSNIDTDVKSCLQELVSCQVDNLSILTNETQDSNRVSQSNY
jgi:hypothetical protein